MDPVVAGVARLGLATLFAVSLLHKLRDPAVFRASVRGYELLPPRLVPASAWLLIGSEGLAAMGLLWPGADPLGGSMALALLALYSTAVGINLARGRRDIDCGCLGPALRQPLSAWLLLRNGLLMLAAAALLMSPGARAIHWLDRLTILGGLAMVVLLWSAVHELAALQSRPGTRAGASGGSA
jgi:hypothetical protein